MGIAAYNRGSSALAEEIRRDLERYTEFEIMERLSALPKKPDALRPFGPVKIKQDRNSFNVYCPVTGFGFWYPTIQEAVSSWNIYISGYGNGEFTAEPMPGSDWQAPQVAKWRR